MRKLRILRIYQEEKVSRQKLELKGHNVIFSGNLYSLSNELSFFCWHGCPFKYLPSDFYPENIVAIDLSYSNIKQLWTTPKCFKKLKVMKLSYCCNLTTTPDLSEITNLEELSLEGCVNLVSVHPSIGMLKRLVVLNLTRCLKVDKLPEALGQIKSLMELHVDRTAITELPSFVSCLTNLESLSFGGQGKIQPRWWTAFTAPFGLPSKKQHPPRPVSLAGLHMLKKLNFSYCNLEQVPESIGGLSFLEELNLKGNHFTSLPGILCQLSHLYELYVDDCKKLEVLPELPPSVGYLVASGCTSLREVWGSIKDTFRIRNNDFSNCPKLIKNVSIDSEGSISKTECVDSSITSQSFPHHFYAILGSIGLQKIYNRREFFFRNFIGCIDLDIIYHGNNSSSIPEWSTNTSLGKNHVKVELPSEEDSRYGKRLRGFGTCVVFKCKNPFSTFERWYSVKNLDGAYLMIVNDIPFVIREYLKKEEKGIHEESYMIWLHYKSHLSLGHEWREAKKCVTFSFFGENNEDYEVKEWGVRLIYDGDSQQDGVTYLNILQDLPTPSQNGGAMNLYGPSNFSRWSW